MWKYRYPNKTSYVPVSILWPLVTIFPIFFFVLHYIFTRNYNDLKAALLGHSLACGLNGLLVDIIKLTVGRPRPDFFFRCFPDGIMNSEMKCTGDHWQVIDGRKSFPSGHSSFSFAGLGFLAFYLIGKFKIFTEEGRGVSYRIFLSFTPFVIALLVAISRTMDYHHWWQDVTVGSIIGILLAYFTYRQYFPQLNSRHPNLDYESIKQQVNFSKDSNKNSSSDIEKDIKWI